jgi:hypothetical protein
MLRIIRGMEANAADPYLNTRELTPEEKVGRPASFRWL